MALTTASLANERLHLSGCYMCTKLQQLNDCMGHIAMVVSTTATVAQVVLERLQRVQLQRVVS